VVFRRGSTVVQSVTSPSRRGGRGRRLYPKALGSNMLDSLRATLQEKRVYTKEEMVQMGPFKSSPMGFGTWAWGNTLLWNYEQDADEELQKVFNLMVSKGINLFDTADSYGTGALEGRSEVLLGKFTNQYPGSKAMRNQIHIATKLAAYPWRITPKQWVGSCKESLNRIGAEKISMAQLHWSTANYAPLQERLMWDGLVAIYDAGLVDAVGLSNYGPKQLEKIHKYLTKRGVPVASCQVQYSLVSRGPLQENVKAACDDLGIAMIAYSPLGLGMLTGRHSPYDRSTYPSLPNPRSILFNQVLPNAGPLLQIMEEIATQRRKSMSQIALNWCICKGTVPIAGARNLKQAESNLGALGWRLSDSEVMELDKASINKMTQNIFQTK
jgi:pyridoxine 4-dehydrogenase